MDETANGVREQLVQWFARDIAHTGKSPSEVADAILARFDVTEKPVVTAEELGKLVCHAALEPSFAATGRVMQEQLEAKGLTIVRIEEAAE